MSDDEVGAVTLTVGDYNIVISTRPPGLLGDYLTHAKLVENFPITDDRSSVGYCFVAVGTGDWPQLVVTQRFSPAGHGFAPGLLLVPETATLFVGAGTRLLGYHREITGEWQTTFVDQADTGFWAWRQHGDLVFMSAELELAAWTTNGTKLWSTFVEPPWSYQLADDEVHLDVMGTHSAFNKHTGPTSTPRTST